MGIRLLLIQHWVMQIQETGAAMSDVLLELNEDASSTSGMTGCLSCSVDIFTMDSAKRFAAGLQVTLVSHCHVLMGLTSS